MFFKLPNRANWLDGWIFDLSKGAAIGIVFFLSGEACADEQKLDKCADVLVKDVNIKLLSKQSQLAWMKLINQSNYAQIKKDAQASVPGYFDGNFNDFSDK